MYSFGGLIFELLCGSEPWHWVDAGALEAQRRAEIQSGRKRNTFEAALSLGLWRLVVSAAETDRIVKRLLEIMQKCLSSEPGDRPSAPEVNMQLTEEVREYAQSLRVLTNGPAEAK